MLTGQRRSEVGKMTVTEINLQKRTWTIPAPPAKNDQTHVVPLSDTVLAILESSPVARSKARYGAKTKLA